MAVDNNTAPDDDDHVPSTTLVASSRENSVLALCSDVSRTWAANSRVTATPDRNISGALDLQPAQW